ncbi:MAG: TonB-dependent receptor [Gammaproteobacteria bacterium]
MGNNKMKRAFLLLSILGSVTTDAVAEAPTVLDTVVVSATRSEQPTVPTPASITVISEEDIAQSGAGNVAELLKARAGVQVSDKYGDGTSGAVFDMRGFGDAAISNTLIMVDGRRLNNSSDMSAPDVSTIALKDVERIEIIQGSAGTLFGNQAVGGVINIITRTPQEFHADVNLSMGSYVGRSLTTSVSNRIDNGISYRLSAEKKESDNYRDNSDVDYENLLARVDYEYSGGKIFGEFNYTDEDRELPGALFLTQIKADRRQSTKTDYSLTQTNLGRFGLSHNLTDDWSFDVELAYRDVDLTSSYSGSISTQNRYVYTLTPRLVGVVPMNGGEAQFTIGSDIETTDYRTSWNTDVDQKIYALYLQAVIPINEQWSITGGARRALVRNYIIDSTAFPGGENLDDGVTVGTIGLVYQPDQSWRWFARADENFRFAKADEHTFTVAGTTGLNNQTGISYEIGGEWNSNYGSVKATAYRLNLENEISFDATANGPWGPLFGANVNLDATERNGLILEAMARLHQDMKIGFNYSYVDAVTTSGTYKGNRVPLVAEHSAAILFDYTPNHVMNMHVEAKYVGEQYLSGD